MKSFSFPKIFEQSVSCFQTHRRFRSIPVGTTVTTTCQLPHPPARTAPAQIITGLVRGCLSQRERLDGVLEASEHSFYAFLSRFDAICTNISGVQEPLRPVMLGHFHHRGRRTRNTAAERCYLVDRKLHVMKIVEITRENGAESEEI